MMRWLVLILCALQMARGQYTCTGSRTIGTEPYCDVSCGDCGSDWCTNPNTGGCALSGHLVQCSAGCICDAGYYSTTGLTGSKFSPDLFVFPKSFLRIFRKLLLSCGAERKHQRKIDNWSMDTRIDMNKGHLFLPMPLSCTFDIISQDRLPATYAILETFPVQVSPLRR